MGILNRTPDSFFDRGEFFALDATMRRAEQLVDEGADILDVGGVKAGPGPDVGEPEELDRVIPAVAAVRARFDVPISVDTWRSEVARAAYAAGAALAAAALGVARGCRIVRAHDVRGTRRVCDTIAAVLEAA